MAENSFPQMLLVCSGVKSGLLHSSLIRLTVSIVQVARRSDRRPSCFLRIPNKQSLRSEQRESRSVDCYRVETLLFESCRYQILQHLPALYTPSFQHLTSQHHTITMPGAMKTRCHTRAEGRKSSTRRQQDSPSSPANDDEKRAKKMRILKRFKCTALAFFRLESRERPLTGERSNRNHRSDCPFFPRGCLHRGTQHGMGPQE